MVEIMPWGAEAEANNHTALRQYRAEEVLKV